MKQIPIVISRVRRLLGLLTFKSSQNYWIERYKRGDNSGEGSYGRLAQYKAGFLNEFVETNGIQTIIEYGCGDGNQLLSAKYSSYIGYDISPDAVSICKALFKDDPTKSFHCMEEYTDEKAELTLSLDVIYHLVEDSVFEQYMTRLFNSSERFTIIYSTNEPDQSIHGPHIRHRRFTGWVQANLPDWELVEYIPNPLAANSQVQETSKADFFVFQKSR